MSEITNEQLDEISGDPILYGGKTSGLAAELLAARKRIVELEEGIKRLTQKPQKPDRWLSINDPLA